MAEKYPHCMDIEHFVVEGHLDCAHHLAIVNGAAVDIHVVQLFIWTPVFKDPIISKPK